MNIVAVCMLLLAIVAALLLADWLAKKQWLPLPIARKMLHVVGVGACTIALAFFPNVWLLQVIIAGFTVLLLAAVHYNWIGLNKGPRKSWGIALFPISFFILLLLFANGKQWLVIYPMAILTLADAAAAVFGEVYAKRYFHLTTDKKSLLGSAVFVAVCFCLLAFLPLSKINYLHLPYFATYAWWQWALVSAGIAMVLAAVEATCSSGFDNLALPLAAAWLLLVTLNDFKIGLIHLPIAILLTLCFSFFTYKKKWLDAGGAATAGLLGVVVWVSGQWQLALPMLVFFVGGSLLGKLNKRKTLATDAKHHKPRDWQQVICNGGVGGFCLLAYALNHQSIWLICYWASIAVSMADTAASEIGMRFGGSPVDIINFKKLPVGISGGISGAGTVGGLLGAFAIASLGAQLVSGEPITLLIFIAAAGFAGMLLDSVLGSLLQIRYRDNGQLTEYAAANTAAIKDKGWYWMSNDVVNLLSNMAITALSYALALSL